MAGRSSLRVARSFVLAGLPFAAAAAPAAAQFGGTHLIQAGGAGIERVRAADLDGDGDLDVLAARAGAPALAWYENLGVGSFGPPRPFGAQPYSASDVRAADVDQDGDLDVVAAVDYYVPQTGSDPRVVLYVNQGGGAFAAPTSLVFSGGSTIDRVALVDLEGDGDLDVFYDVYGLASVYVLRRQSGGFAQPQLVTSQAAALRDMHIEDLDGDGDADLLVASWNLDEVSWFENVSGSGAFGPKQVLNAQADGALSVNAADLDGDGDLDVLSTSSEGSDAELHWYENLGNGSFGPTRLISNADWPSTFATGADVDGDGDLDVLLSEFYGGAWYPNDGAGHFGPRQVILQSAVAAQSAAAEDLDGDGDLDFLVGWNPSAGVGRIAWFDNRVNDPLGARYCSPAVANSTGLPGVLSALGSPVVAVGRVRLLADDLPPHKAGIFIASQNQGLLPNFGGGAGTLCVAGPIKRIKSVQQSGAAGHFEHQLDVGASFPIAPGQTWHFQAWHRDVGGTSNLTDGLRIDFVP